MSKERVVGHGASYSQSGDDRETYRGLSGVSAAEVAEHDAHCICRAKELCRCETCRWPRTYRCGFVGEKLEEMLACGNPDSAWYMSPVGERESCMLNWEPKA